MSASRRPSGPGPMLVALAAMAVLLVIVALVNAGGGGGDGDGDGGGTGAGTTAAPGETVGTEAVTTRPAPDADGPSIAVSAAGDIMMGTPQYGLPPDDGATFFDPVADLLTGDVVLGNLEGTLSTTPGSKCGEDSENCFAFQTPPAYAAHLASAGFNVMNLANNHANDYGAAGLEETRAALEAAGIEVTGRAGVTAVIDAGGGRAVAVVGFAPYEWADPLLDLQAAAGRVRDATAVADVVIVTFHGGAEGADHAHVPDGPEEYLGEARGDVRAFAHAVVDAGADLVLGHGPHVLRGLKVYEGRLIAYSLGNFAGFRAFSLDGPLSESMVLGVEVAPDGEFRSGTIRPTRLVGEGTPEPGGDAITTVRALSRADFGAAAPSIDDAGAIRPRA